MKDTIRKASKVVEAPRHRAEEAVRKIAENPDFDLMDAPQIALDLLRKGKGQADRARAVIDDSIRRRLNEMGLATKEDVERLQARVAELEETVALAAPPAPKSGPKARTPRATAARASSTGPTRPAAPPASPTGPTTGPAPASRPPRARAPRIRPPAVGPTDDAGGESAAG
ncbi:MAG TPA: hypothetical protein VFW71_03050 [Actinomycetota bacterium]|nr:hypothetical protein [Actinomycetota bacterium]